MPSLVPKLQPEIPALSLREVFASEKTAGTVERVIKYLDFYYTRFSNRSEIDRNSPFVTVEEFDLLMPTASAFFAEIALCEAILRHSGGKLTDLEMKAVLDAFVEAHLYVYERGTRRAKTGSDEWFETDLVYVYSPFNQKIGFTCNAVQSWLVWLLHRDIELRVLRLNV